MANKDFLTQFSNENKPDSFKEEERTPIVKTKKPVNKLALIITIVVILVLGILAYFLFLAPKIEMPNFVEQSKSDVASWVKQQGIETQGIVFKNEYSFDYDEDIVISQSIEEGKKIKDNAKITFVISLGADPDETIKVPDLKSMDKEEISKWIKDNKLQKAKINTSFNEEFEEGQVIDYSFSGCEEDNFTRGCSLKISISKGPQPVSTVTVESFVGKAYSDAVSWASSKKLKADKKEEYSNTVEYGNVISQSASAGDKIPEGSTITFTISKGKGIVMPNLSSLTNADVDKFIQENGAYVDVEKKYVNSTDYVISQSVSAGKVLGSDDKVKIVLNLGNTFYLKDIGINNIVGSSVSSIADIFNNYRYMGIDGYIGRWSNSEGIYSYDYENGIIVSASVQDSKGKIYNKDERIPLDIRIDVTVSKGKIYVISLDEATCKQDDHFVTARLVDALANQGINFTIDSDIEETCELRITDASGTSIIAFESQFEIKQDQTVEIKKY